MAVVKFSKVRVVGLNSWREDILKQLQKEAALEVTKVAEEDIGSFEETDDELGRKLDQVEFCLKSLGQSQKKGIVETLFPGKIGVHPELYRKTIDGFPLDKVYESCREREEKLRELNSETERLRARYLEFLPWRELNLRINQLGMTESCTVSLVKVPARSLDPLREKVSGVGVFEIVRETRTTCFCLTICLKEDIEFLEKVLKDFSGELIRLPELDEADRKLKPAEIIEKITGRLAQIDESIKTLKLKEEKDFSHFPPLLVLHDYLSNIRRRKDAQHDLGFTRSVFVLEGWIRQRDILRISRQIEEEFSETHIEEVEPKKGELPPVELKNTPAVKPFEAVTELYGLPHHREMDPTPLFAPFFALFFALCLTDAGYGLILIIISMVCLKKLNLSTGGKYLLKLLSIAGVVTIFTGLLTGGIFGFQFEEVPQKLSFLRDFRDSLMVLDLSCFVAGTGIGPVLSFFVISLGLGFLQVWFGFFVRMYQELKKREIKEAIFSHFPWLLILPALIIMGIVKKPDVILLGLVEKSPLGSSWLGVAKWFIFTAFLMMFFKPGRGNIFKRTGSVIYELYDGVIGCFGNIISYVRLFALGMTTLAMAIATNTIAGIAMNIPKVGFVIAVPIVIGGHLFNTVINTLGGFIHTVRLQFVEFFTKFYQGGGRAFHPLSVENKYTEFEKLH